MAATAPIRLQKYIADSGLCSRRAADALIARGEVRVNGSPARPGTKVVPGVDRVVVSGRPLRGAAQPRVTLAVHKPRGLVCTNEDPHHGETIISVLPRRYAPLRFFCAGRLDKESEGLVILTTDGALAHRLMHPSNHVVKRYQVRLKQPFPAARLAQLRKGVVLEEEHLKVEQARLIGGGAEGASRHLEVRMHHGRKREIRQLFAALGHEVLRLQRDRIGSLSLRGIPLHAVKQLSRKEIDLLFREPGSGEPAERRTNHHVHD